MADHQQCARIAPEPAFEPDQRIQIQVVGGLVEQQQITRTHQRARQLQSHAPATRKAVDRTLQFLGLESQPQNQRLRPGSGVVRTGIIQRGVRMGHGHAVAAGFRCTQLGLCLRQPGITTQHKRGSVFIRLGHVLLDLCQAPGRWYNHITTVFVQRAVEQAEQARFACAVAPYQCHLFTRIDGDRHTVQQHLGSTLQRDITEHNHAACSINASCVSSSTWSPPALVSSHTGFRCGKAASK